MQPDDRKRRREAEDAVSAGLPGDVEFYLRLALQSPAPVLELGCGTGRITLSIARAGVPVIGLDRSRESLDVARATACRLPIGSGAPEWIEADMSDFSLSERFGLIFVPYRGFQYLLCSKKQQAALTCIYRHLLPGGLLALNIFNTEVIDVLSRHATAGRLVGGGPRRKIAGARPRPRISRTFRSLRLRYPTRREMEDLLRQAGLEVLNLFGWFDGSPFGAMSTEMIWIARRPGRGEPV